MKTYKEFIKEINHIQEKLDATVYGQLRLGSKPPVVTSQSIKRGVDSAIKNMGTGKPSLSTSEKRGSYGLSGSGYIRLGYSSGSTKKPPTTTKTPPPTKTKPTPTTTKTTPTPTKIRPPKPTPTTSTPSPSTNVLVKGSNTSSSSTNILTKNPSTSTVRPPVRIMR